MGCSEVFSGAMYSVIASRDAGSEVTLSAQISSTKETSSKAVPPG